MTRTCSLISGAALPNGTAMRPAASENPLTADSRDALWVGVSTNVTSTPGSRPAVTRRWRMSKVPKARESGVATLRPRRSFKVKIRLALGATITALNCGPETRTTTL